MILMKSQIFNYEPYLTRSDKNAVKKSLSTGIANPSLINDFESYVSNFLGEPVVACNSGTSALHLSLLAIDIQPGDEIICPSTTFAASWNVIKYAGASAIFVDIDKSTWCIDPSLIEEKITKKTKAIIAVDLHGNPCDYKALYDVCNKYKIHLISDAAGAIGSYYENKPLGCLADINCMSMNLNKIITSNGGGIICLGKKFKDKEDKIRQLLNQSFISSPKEGYDYADIGYNYRFNAINAAIAKSQFSRLSYILQKKSEINLIYKDKLSEMCDFQESTDNSLPNNWMNTVVFKSKNDRNKVHKHLRTNLIESKLTYKPVNEIQWLKNEIKEKFKNSKCLYDRALSLPSGINLSKKDIDFICKNVKIGLGVK
jgi:perosamine synthetase